MRSGPTVGWMLACASVLAAVPLAAHAAGAPIGIDAQPAATAESCLALADMPEAQAVPRATAAADPAAAPAAPCGPKSDPYVNYQCLDSYLGDGVFERMANYYKLEWGKSGAPSDPNAPPSRRPSWDPSPQSTPPMPFTE